MEMETFITAITTAVSPATLWAALGGVAALIGTMVIFSFGYRVVRRAVSGVSQGKAKM